MDFLLLAALYTFVFAVASFVLLCGANQYFRNGLIGWVRFNLIGISQVLQDCICRCLPRPFTRFAEKAIHYISSTRNPCLQLLYCSLMAYGCIVYTLRVLPHFDKFNVFAITTYILILINTIFFGVCSTMDPGVIILANHTACLDEYKRYSDRECPTCKFIKPGRSKHCSICNSCVHRFDHHCTWVNNCIGKRNYKYFLGFIFSTAVLCLYVSFVVSVVFMHIVLTTGLWKMEYIDATGLQHQVGLRYLVQHFLVHHTLMFALFVIVFVLGVLLAVFSAFHIYLVLTNQTTNELYKRCGCAPITDNTWPRVPRPRNPRVGAKRRRGDGRGLGGRTEVPKRGTGSLERPKTPYYRSLWQNIVEVAAG